ncbi:hypothetical protein BCUN_2241 [Bifidobacterium cuniculi]|uniref:Uncharacterized protein n=1 Tax=Bifidobacterium cuniculi TaxID=1688 RepID=A0A087AC36_9BIFI|nr:hypothetical protein BCUN_2241 [Bifidobacterium cuniculi]
MKNVHAIDTHDEAANTPRNTHPVRSSRRWSSPSSPSRVLDTTRAPTTTRLTAAHTASRPCSTGRYLFRIENHPSYIGSSFACSVPTVDGAATSVLRLVVSQLIVCADWSSYSAHSVASSQLILRFFSQAMARVRAWSSSAYFGSQAPSSGDSS